MDQELEEFKSRLDLREYAASLGYTLDRRESSRGSSIMRHNGDKVVIKRGGDGHFIYFSVHDDADNGSIIDFAMRRKNLNLGQVRKELRPWIGRPATSLPFSPLVVSGKNRALVEREFAAMRIALRHPYLEEERKIPASLLSSPRFEGRIRIDRHKAAVFPHFDEGGLCGYELKNLNFTGFAEGGEKGLWESHDQADDARLIFTESAIDALSHAALFPDAKARYCSVGGGLNPQQPGLIAKAIKRMPGKAEIVAATDNDETGHKLAGLIGSLILTESLPCSAFRSDFPKPHGADWNDVLKSSFPTAHAMPAAKDGPSF